MPCAVARKFAGNISDEIRNTNDPLRLAETYSPAMTALVESSPPIPKPIIILVSNKNMNDDEKAALKQDKHRYGKQQCIRQITAISCDSYLNVSLIIP